MLNKLSGLSRLFSMAFAIFTVHSAAYAAITNVVPQIQEIYGGSIRAIDVIEPAGTTNQIRVFVTTEFSANSIFYADLNHAATNIFATNNFRFQVVPDFNAQANHGTVNGIAGHPESGRLFVADGNAILSSTMTAGSLVTNIFLLGDPANQFLAVNVHNSVLLALASSNNNNVLYFGALDTGGTFTPGSGSPIDLGLHINMSSDIGLAVHPTNHCVYIIDSTGSNGIRKSSDPVTALSAATTFSTITLPAAALLWTGNKRLGFGPDGRMFVAASAGSNKVIAYSDNDGGSWSVVNTGVGGVGGNNISASSLTNYSLIFGGAFSTNKGEAGSWLSLGTGGGPGQTHANDGPAAFDPLNAQILFVASDQGIASSLTGGFTLFEIDYGLEAVAIQDLDMSADKTLAWTASKSGLRYGVGAPMALQWTPDGIFPTGDGSPYFSIAIDKGDPNGRTVYAGNGNIYKTTDGGTNWTRVWAGESNTNGFPMGGHFAALAAEGQNVVAGFYSGSGGIIYGTGGLVVSQDGGSNWAQAIFSVDVNDVLMINNGVLVATAYNTNSGLGGIYNLSAAGGLAHELNTNVSIRCFALDSAGGVYASGQASDFAVKVYYKPVAGSSWTEVTSSGLPAQQQMISLSGPVMTVGRDSASNDLPIIVVGHSLYYLASGSSAWQSSLDLTYPDGSTINVLYWDELMVGTSEGLYGQAIATSPQTNLTALIALAADFDGDAKADPALYNTNGAWKIKLSSGNYTLLPLTGFLGGSGYTALAADFDGDGKADPAVYNAALELWAIKLSSLNYLAPTVITSFGGNGWQALAGDFDGDRLADPALSNTNGTWQVKLSTAGYATISSVGLLGFAGWTALAADLDGDGKVDPAIYKASTGSWIARLSRANYAIAVLEVGFLGSAGYDGFAADFDGDAYADPTVADPTTGNWKLKLSSGNYSLLELPGFLGE